MGCAACGRGFHSECLRGCKKCHSNEPKRNEGQSRKVTSTPRKSKVSGLKDEKSTGRKRAAQLYPIDKEAPCEWQKKKNCGGGRRPIVGCLNGKQVDRHHGPVKKTTRNEEGNVHRICKDCHNHWHELNDLIYDEQEYNNLPHDPVAASDMEIAAEFLKWQSGDMGKQFELASSKNREKGRAKNLLTE
jgi:hypothetical protein